MPALILTSAMTSSIPPHSAGPNSSAGLISRNFSARRAVRHESEGAEPPPSVLRSRSRHRGYLGSHQRLRSSGYEAFRHDVPQASLGSSGAERSGLVSGLARQGAVL